MRVSEQDRARDGVSAGAILARRARTLTGSTAMITVWTLALAATLLPCAGRAQDATWGANPASGDWNTAATWSPGTVPTGTATFGASSQTTISFSQPDTSIGTMQFNSGAPAYTFMVHLLEFTDRGIINSSGSAPVFTFSAAGGIVFRNASTAANAIINNSTSSEIVFGGTSTAANATITNTGNSSVSFQNTSNAGNATLINAGGGTIEFRLSSSAANTTIANGSGAIFFGEGASAGNATIRNMDGGHASFFSNATAGNATIINTSANSNFLGSLLEFGNHASAGNASITNNALGGTTFADTSSAGNATITTNSGGSIGFLGNSTGGNARFVTNAGGTFDMSGLQSTGMTAGSIEGTGSYFLGSKTLTVGSNNLSTEVSGVIADGGVEPAGSGGGLVKVGTGTLTLSGINTYTGGTRVNGGTLVVNGAIAQSPVTVADGTLAGTGVVGATAVLGGMVAPGSAATGMIGALHVAGNLIVTPDATYAVDLDGAGRSDRIAATGTANLIRATVQVTSANGGIAVNTPYTILTAAGGRTGTFSGVAGNFIFVTPSLSYDPNDVFLTFARNNVSFASAGQTRNQIATGAGLDSLGRGPAFNAVAASSTPAQARVAFDQLSGELHASAAGAMLEDSRYVRDAVVDRLRQPFGGTDGPFAAMAPIGSQVAAIDGTSAGTLAYAAEPAFKAAAKPPAEERVMTAWAQGIGDWGHTDGDGNAAVLRRSTGGVISGVDATFDERWRLGLAGGYSQSSLNVDDRRSAATINNYHLALYGGGQLGAWGLRGGAAFAAHTIDTDRAIVFPGFFDVAKASYDAHTAQMFGEVGRSFALGPVALEPFAGLAYVHLDTGRFAETGAAALTGRDGAFATAFTTLGLHGAGTVALADGKPLTVRGTLGWRHAFGDVTPEALLAFRDGGLPFTVAGVPITRDALLVEAGIGFNLMRNASIGLTYSGQLARAAQDHAARGEINWKF